MATQGFTRETGGVKYQPFSTQAVADPTAAAVGTLAGVAGDVYRETKTQQFAEQGEELRIQGEMTGLLTAGKNPYEIQTGLTEEQVTGRLGEMAQAGGFVPSEMERSELLKAAQRVAKMQTAAEQGLWSRGRYAAEVAILQRGLLNEYPHLKAEIGEAMMRAGVSGATVDYAYSEMESALKQEQISTKSTRDLYMRQAEEGLKLGFGTVQEASSDPVGYLTKYGSAIQNSRMVDTVKKDSEAMKALSDSQATNLIQMRASGITSRVRGTITAVLQETFGQEGTVENLSSLAADPRFPSVIDKAKALLSAAKADDAPLRAKNPDAYDKSLKPLEDFVALLESGAKDNLALKGMETRLKMMESDNLLNFKRQNPELAERVDVLGELSQFLPPGVQTAMANDMALIRYAKGEATGVTDRDGRDAQAIAKASVEAALQSDPSLQDGQARLAAEQGAQFYAANAEYIRSHGGAVPDVEKLYEGLDKPAFAKGLLLASQSGAAAINVDYVTDLGRNSILAMQKEVNKRLSDYKSEKGSLVVSPATGLVQVRWESLGAAVTTPQMNRTRRAIEEEVVRMNKLIKGTTHMLGSEDYSILSGQVVAEGQQ